MQEGLYSYTPIEKDKAFHLWLSHLEDLPSVYGSNNYVVFPHKPLPWNLS